MDKTVPGEPMMIFARRNWVRPDPQQTSGQSLRNLPLNREIPHRRFAFNGSKISTQKGILAHARSNSWLQEKGYCWLATIAEPMPGLLVGASKPATRNPRGALLAPGRAPETAPEKVPSSTSVDRRPADARAQSPILTSLAPRSRARSILLYRLTRSYEIHPTPLPLWLQNSRRPRTNRQSLQSEKAGFGREINSKPLT